MPEPSPESPPEVPSPLPSPAQRAGTVALIGEPNAGKSTLLNSILGEKIAIVSPKPQTTRDRIVGIHSAPGVQIAFVDTPGLHEPRGSRLNRRMLGYALSAVDEVDAVVVVADAARQARREGHALTERERRVVAAVQPSGRPVVVALNKVDRVDKPLLLPCIAAWGEALPEAVAIVPISALRGLAVDVLLTELGRLLPEGPPLYPEDQLTDRPLRFIAAEFVREQLMHQLGQEVPYAAAVEVERWEDEPHLTRIHVAIHLEKSTQKKIVIGRGGEKIKAVGTAAREALEALLGRRVFLETFVRVEEDWTERDRALRRFGYGEALGGGPARAPRGRRAPKGGEAGT